MPWKDLDFKNERFVGNFQIKSALHVSIFTLKIRENSKI